MRRVLATIMASVMIIGMISGCGETKDEAKYLKDVDLEKYVTLGEYKGMDLTATKSEITDADVEDYITYLLESSPETIEVTGRAVQSGDVVNIDFEGKKDGVAFDGGTAEGYELEIGSGSFIPGFEDGLIGCNIGDTVDLDLTFPENYQSADLAGQPVVFTVTVNSITELKVPELTDEYVKGLGVEECQNVAEFKGIVRDAMEESAEITYRNELQTQVSEKILLSNTFEEDVPEGIMNYYKDRIYMSVDAQASYYGMERNDYIVQYLGTTVEEYDKEIEALAVTSAQQAMACALIAQKEGIEVTDEELQEQVELNYANLGYESVEAFNASEELENYRDVLLATEVLNFLIDNANVVEAATTEEVTTEAAQ